MGHTPVRRFAVSEFSGNVFTLRERHDKLYIRPISARFMHQKEIEFYESQIGTENNS